MKSTPEQKAEMMKLWLAWKDSMGNKVVDFGTPCEGKLRLEAKAFSKEISSEIAGYSIIQASDIEEAKSLLVKHPHLSSSKEGIAIEVHECIQML